MTDAVNPAGEALSDANASPQTEVEADAKTEVTGSEAESSPAVKKADDDATEKVRSRIDELTRARRQAERDRDYERSEREQLRRELEEIRRKPVVETPAPQGKTLADFGFDESQYQRYLFDEVSKRADAAAETRLREESERNRTSSLKAKFASREALFAKTVDDYAEVARDPSVPVSPAMADVITDSDEGPALLYFLGKNLELADQIARMSPLASARELGRIEARLIGEREKAKAKTVSKAPPPTPKIEGKGDPAIEKDPGSMSDKEFATWRRRQIAQRR